MTSPNQNQVEVAIQLIEHLGLVDDQLGMCYSLKQPDNNQVLVDLLTIFLTEIPADLAIMEALLTANVVDFADVAEESIKLVGKSGSIGAVHVKGAFYSLWEAAEIHSKEGCLEHLNAAKNAHAAVRPHLELILQLERQGN